MIVQTQNHKHEKASITKHIYRYLHNIKWVRIVYYVVGFRKDTTIMDLDGMVLDFF